MIERTHWDDCWRDPAHHKCAAEEVFRLRCENARLRGDLAGANRECEVLRGREFGYMAQVEKAEAEVERLKADAARYRWLRDVATGDQWDYIMTTEDTDAAIDAARGES